MQNVGSSHSSILSFTYAAANGGPKDFGVEDAAIEIYRQAMIATPALTDMPMNYRWLRKKGAVKILHLHLGPPLDAVARALMLACIIGLLYEGLLLFIANN